VVWTHERRVVIRDKCGFHCRPAAHLAALMRKAALGTRLGFGVSWLLETQRVVDFS
jgi:hypothetical protein